MCSAPQLWKAGLFYAVCAVFLTGDGDGASDQAGVCHMPKSLEGSQRRISRAEAPWLKATGSRRLAQGDSKLQRGMMSLLSCTRTGGKDGTCISFILLESTRWAVLRSLPLPRGDVERGRPVVWRPGAGGRELNLLLSIELFQSSFSLIFLISE